ncbi:hypothetical protein [Bacillus infantis]|uniref:hypothetical protein n=1 Tax=Bacillus infantis TaxID=324767 RepID=UPI003CF86376
MRKGDIVVFIIGDDLTEYRVIDEYVYLGRNVVDLKGYSGEVGVEYLKKVQS